MEHCQAPLRLSKIIHTRLERVYFCCKYVPSASAGVYKFSLIMTLLVVPKKKKKTCMNFCVRFYFRNVDLFTVELVYRIFFYIFSVEQCCQTSMWESGWLGDC